MIDRFVVGCGDGSIFFYNLTTRKYNRLIRKPKIGVEDIQWNPGENYIMASYEDGSMKLFEMDMEEERFSFERQGAGIKSISWIGNMSGDFLTSTDKIGAFKIWNASKKYIY